MVNNTGHSLSTLLGLDGEIIGQDKGYFVKIEAKKVNPTPQNPQGLDYSLTLHDKFGTRVLGFDNAHRVKPPKKFGKKIVTNDHEHRHSKDKGVPYTFVSGDKLIADFFAKVDEYIKNH